jgi:ATP-dependent Clp protease ATP-binding subunit ClpA
MAVFRSLGRVELRKIVDIELDLVKERLRAASSGKQFHLALSDSAREFLLEEGCDARYGARHLKRAIERWLVHPLSNLITSNQIRRGDCICVSHFAGSRELTFNRETGPETKWDFDQKTRRRLMS